MTLRVGSFCSGIAAPEMAWQRLGFLPQFFSEIDPFACAVLAHHYPTIPNLGDMTKVGDEAIERHRPIDVVVAGTPCQSFSVAGLRKGMADPRGNLALVLLGLVDRIRPRWLVWENVPGVLSSADGRDFGAFLGALGELGYGWAYRVLDAQYVGVPQRRRRVFVVGHLGDWRRAGAVLLERHCLSGNPPPSREAQPRVAEGVAGCLNSGGGNGGFRTEPGEHLIAFGGNNTSGPIDVATACQAHGGPHGRQDFASETFVCDTAPPVTHNPYGDHESREGLLVAHSLRADGFDAGEDGTGRGTPLVPCRGFYANHSGSGHVSDSAEISPSLKAGHGGGSTVPAVAYQQHGSDVGKMGTLRKGHGDVQSGVPFIINAAESCATQSHAREADVARCLDSSGGFASAQGGTVVAFDTTQVTSDKNYSSPQPGDPCHPLAAGAHAPAIAFQERGREGGRNVETQEEVAYSLNAPNGGGRRHELNVAASMAVRRLTPRECERLQGFPDDYTLVPCNDKPASDGPRYRAIGNSMAVNVLEWIGHRIMEVEATVLTESRP